MKHHSTSSSKNKHPFWLKSSVTLIGLSLLFVILSYGKFILMPLAFAAFVSMLLNPVVSKLESWKLGRAFSIILTLLLVLIVFSGIVTLISAQFVQFSERIPEVTERLKSVTTDGVEFLEETVGISEEERTDYLEQGLSNLIDKSGQYIGSVVSATTSAFTLMSLLPIFIFFMLYYKDMYQTFFRRLFERKEGNSMIDDVLDLLTPLLVIAVFGTVQFLEGNFITPRIVGSKVSINPFMAMLALIIGGELWGISGMILFVPLIGILRVIFEQIEELKPYGYLLGNKIEY